MIFVTVGSQKFQFNRLLREIDNLVEQKKIAEEVFAQTGYSDYIPKNYKYKSFLNRDEFNEVMGQSDKVITHGGTGSIIVAVKKGKKVIAIPRLEKYGEHVDDHQLQIIREFTSMNFITSIIDIEDLEKFISNLKFLNFKSYVSNTNNIIASIENFINRG